MSVDYSFVWRFFAELFGKGVTGVGVGWAECLGKSMGMQIGGGFDKLTEGAGGGACAKLADGEGGEGDQCNGPPERSGDEIEQSPGSESAGAGVGGIRGGDIGAQVVGKDRPKAGPSNGQVEAVRSVDAGVGGLPVITDPGRALGWLKANGVAASEGVGEAGAGINGLIGAV